jgi:hypothetical protein
VGWGRRPRGSCRPTGSTTPRSVAGRSESCPSRRSG